MSYNLDSIIDAAHRFTADLCSIRVDDDSMPLWLPLGERVRRLQAASGGAWAVDALVEMRPDGQHLKRADEDRYRWAHRVCLSIAEEIERRTKKENEDHSGGGWPILPRVIDGGAMIVIGGGASALALAWDGRFFAMQGTVPDDQWPTHWRRKALVSSELFGEYIISRHALAALLDGEGATDKSVEDHSPGDRSIGAITLSILESGQDTAKIIVRRADDAPVLDWRIEIQNACERAWGHHWGGADRVELRRTMLELSGLEAASVDAMISRWRSRDLSAA